MKTSANVGIATLALVLGWAGMSAAGTVEVKWVERQTYSDAGRSTMERGRTLQELGEHLRTLGSRLPEGQTLRLEVLDLDLAGELRPHATQELRVLRGGADWPQMALRYTLLAADGRPLRSGQSWLSDLHYLVNTHRAGSLAYEKRMLDDWFKAQFTPR